MCRGPLFFELASESKSSEPVTAAVTEQEMVERKMLTYKISKEPIAKAFRAECGDAIQKQYVRDETGAGRMNRWMMWCLGIFALFLCLSRGVTGPLKPFQLGIRRSLNLLSMFAKFLDDYLFNDPLIKRIPVIGPPLGFCIDKIRGLFCFLIDRLAGSGSKASDE